MSVCRVEGCERPRAVGAKFKRTLCWTHVSRKYRKGDVLAEVPIVERQKNDGPLNYRPAHIRVSTARGRASEQPCVDCGEQAAEWSYDHASTEEITGPVVSRGVERVLKWSSNPDDYSARCHGCHVKFDHRSAANV